MNRSDRKMEDALNIEWYESNIIRCFECASDKEIETGLRWYEEARIYCATLADKYHISDAVAATVVSALSPKNPWESNKLDAQLVLAGWYNNVPWTHLRSIQTYRANIRKAYDVLNTGNIELVHAPKTYNFAQCLISADTDAVCIDRHTFSLAHGRYVGNNLPVSLTEHRYHNCAEAYRNVASVLGIKPYQLQAITWVTWHRLIANKRWNQDQTSFDFGANA